MTQYICEDVEQVLTELESKFNFMIKNESNEDKKSGLQMAYDALKQTQDDWQTDFSWI